MYISVKGSEELLVWNGIMGRRDRHAYVNQSPNHTRCLCASLFIEGYSAQSILEIFSLSFLLHHSSPSMEPTFHMGDPRGRKRPVPMNVLALGMSQSATESLARALEILGFKTYHDQSTNAEVSGLG